MVISVDCQFVIRWPIRQVERLGGERGLIHDVLVDDARSVEAIESAVDRHVAEAVCENVDAAVGALIADGSEVILKRRSHSKRVVLIEWIARGGVEILEAGNNRVKESLDRRLAGIV